MGLALELELLTPQYFATSIKHWISSRNGRAEGAVLLLLAVLVLVPVLVLEVVGLGGEVGVEEAVGLVVVDVDGVVGVVPVVAPVAASRMRAMQLSPSPGTCSNRMRTRLILSAPRYALVYMYMYA